MKTKKRSVKLCMEVLEERYCPAGNTWCPVDAGNYYSDANNWTGKVVPTQVASFDGSVSNASCNIDISPNVQFSLSNGYTGRMVIESGVNCDLKGGYIDETSGMGDRWVVNFIDNTSLLTFDNFSAGAASTSTIYNSNFNTQGDGGSIIIAPNDSVVAGAYPNFSTTLITSCEVYGTLWLGCSQQGVPGNGSTVGFNGSVGNLIAEGSEGSSGTINVYEAPAAATLIGPGSGGGVTIETTADDGGDVGTLNFVDQQTGLPGTQEIDADIENFGTTNFHGGKWSFTDRPLATTDSIDVVQGALNLSSTPSNTFSLCVTMTGNAEAWQQGAEQGTINVFTNCTWQPASLTYIAGTLQIAGIYTMTVTGDVTFGSASIFQDWIGGGSDGIGLAGCLYDPEGNVTISKVASSIEVQFIPGTSVPAQTVYTLIATGNPKGITGEFKSVDIPQHPVMREINPGNPNGESAWSITS